MHNRALLRFTAMRAASWHSCAAATTQPDHDQYCERAASLLAQLPIRIAASIRARMDAEELFVAMLAQSLTAHRGRDEHAMVERAKF